MVGKQGFSKGLAGGRGESRKRSERLFGVCPPSFLCCFRWKQVSSVPLPCQCLGQVRTNSVPEAPAHSQVSLLPNQQAKRVGSLGATSSSPASSPAPSSCSGRSTGVSTPLNTVRHPGHQEPAVLPQPGPSRLARARLVYRNPHCAIPAPAPAPGAAQPAPSAGTALSDPDANLTSFLPQNRDPRRSRGPGPFTTHSSHKGQGGCQLTVAAFPASRGDPHKNPLALRTSDLPSPSACCRLSLLFSRPPASQGVARPQRCPLF